MRHLFFLLLLLPSFARADFEIGLGTTSSTSARLVPALSAAIGSGEYAFTGSSTGVKTSVYHFSAYTVGAVKRWAVGPFWWGDLEAGFGLAFAYTHYGLKNSPAAATEDTQTDFTGGPLFQFRWKFLGPLYLGLDNLFGLRFPKGLLSLSAQDVILFSAGVNL